MNWAAAAPVLAPIAAVVVTAALGALGIAREQSAMRQLERVTAVLKETPEHAAARGQLEWLRDALAAHVNAQYRAPRHRFIQTVGWVTTLGGCGIGVWFYMVLALATERASPDPADTPTWVALAIFFGLLIIAAAVWSGPWFLRGRSAAREGWIEKARPDDSAAPKMQGGDEPSKWWPKREKPDISGGTHDRRMKIPSIGRARRGAR